MPHKKPAYPRVGSGEDFPARRPGVRVGEDARGRKRMQPTRASQARGRGRRSIPTADLIPLAPRRPKVTPIPPGRKPGGRDTRRRWV
jgi:hypothetical protein